MGESTHVSFLWLRHNDTQSLLVVAGSQCDPCGPSRGTTVASSRSDKQHFHLLVAPRQPTLVHREKKSVSGFKTMHKAFHSERLFERAYTMSLHWKAFLWLLALEKLQIWNRAELSCEPIYWGCSKFLFCQTAPTS